MEKNTIGQFISALRKANGLTQQEVADRLNVSNKAVSRWERDECAPDISLIPALAELLGVTCDELLKGERIPSTEDPERRNPKVEKQVRSLINRTLSEFRARIWISVITAFMGLVCMFGISYGFFQPILGFAVMMLLEACAFGVAVVVLNRAKDMKNENELFAEAEEALTAKFTRQLGSYSFTAFFAIAASILLSLPLVLWASAYFNSVMTTDCYFSRFFWVIALALTLGYLKLKAPCGAWITGEDRHPEENAPGTQKVRTMSRLQLGLLLGGLLCGVASVYLDTSPKAQEIGSVIFWIGSCVLTVASFACPVVYFVKFRELRKAILLPGIRNILVAWPVGEILTAYTLWWSDDGRYLAWNGEAIWLALGAALLLFVVFALLEVFQKRRK